jgi:hypothetical protein
MEKEVEGEIGGEIAICSVVPTRCASFSAAKRQSKAWPKEIYARGGWD